MTQEEAIAYIHSMVWDRSATGYEHAERLLGYMGHPERDLKFIHIGGTNGKGSTAALLASVLQRAGYRTGLYTSPFIFHFSERIQVDGMPIAGTDLAAITQEIKMIVKKHDLHPSEFALICCIAFAYFKQQGCEIVVLEVGMGGAKDSTNVIPCPEMAVLTNIGLDHTEYLGKTIEEIAMTKAGILKRGGNAVLYPSGKPVEHLLADVCREREIAYTFPDFQKIRIHERSLRGQRFSYGEYEDLFLPLTGNHQLCNGVTALCVISSLREKGWKIPASAVRTGFQKVTWPGRFEVLSDQPVFIVDGGHNPQCMEVLADNIRTYLTGKSVIALTGVLKDKEYEKMYEPVFPMISEYVCITPPSPRSLPGRDLCAFLEAKGKTACACDSVRDAVNLARKKAGQDGAVVCFGSLYSVAEIKTAFLET